MLNLNVKLITMIISVGLCIGGGYSIHKINENRSFDIEMPTEDSANNTDDSINFEKDNETSQKEDNVADNSNSLESNIESNANIIGDTITEDEESNLSQSNSSSSDWGNNVTSNNNCNINVGDSNNSNGNNNVVIPNNSQGNSQNAITSSSENFMAQVEQLIFNKVNEERSKNGVSNLTYSSTMEKYARTKSKDMGDNNYFDHKDLSGNYITAKMKSDGVTYSAWAENIAYISGMTDANRLADKFMTNWMNSEGHRKNILSAAYSSIGVGVYKIGNKVYATQEFYR